mgnify:FL=1
MTELFEINKLINKGFSLITADKNKRPLGSWKDAQTNATDVDTFKSQFLSKGSEGVCGLVTGFNDLEVMDVDLKVFSTAQEKKEWFGEYISFLQDNIMDFDDKFVIYKTKNEGYHILYKTKRVEGNLKVAKLKGHSQQVLETRGVGGYVVLYANSYNKRSYLDIDYISDSDREILFAVSRSYNFIDDVIVSVPKKEKNTTPSVGLTPWDDYNNKVSILDIIGNDFDVVRMLKDRAVIRRHGADSAHSGYVYNDSGLMYLFTSGTSFEAEKGYNAFAVYSQLMHNGDFTAASRDLYSQGYGDRQVIETPKEIIEEAVVVSETDFPLDIFPAELQTYIKACNESLNNSIDYMACSLLFLTSIIIGNSLELEVKRGWKESANLWMSLVGKAGVGKTPSISSITFPLSRLNNIEIKKHIEDAQKYENYMNMNEKEKAMSSVVEKPKKTQFIVNDVTLEALVELHNENPNGIGVLKDELAGFFKDMNKYREGGDLEHWLSSWSGKEINLNRKTAKSSFVEKAFLPIMGGIQPSILDAFHTDENKDNGFLDRMLFTFPEIEIERYSDKEMSQQVLDWYESYINTFYQSTKRNIKYSEGGTIEPITAKFTPEANAEWIRIFNEITDIQNGEDEAESMKSMLPKQKAYICRFALIINTLASHSDKSINKDVIEVESVLKAERLSKYFVSMNKKLIVESIKRNKSKIVLDKKRSSEENFRAVYKKNPNVTNKDMATLIGVSVRTIANYKNNLK